MRNRSGAASDRCGSDCVQLFCTRRRMEALKQEVIVPAGYRIARKITQVSKVYPRTGNEGPEVYSSFKMGVGGQRHAPAALSVGRNPSCGPDMPTY